MSSPRNNPVARIWRVRLLAGAAVLAASVSSLSAVPRHAHAESPLKTGLGLIERHYLFYRELEPEKLLGSALEYMETVIEEVQADPSGNHGYRLRANECELRLESPPDGKLRSLAPVLSQAAVMISTCVREIPEDLPSVDHVLLSGVLSGLDPYSVVLHGTRNREHSIQFRGQLAGIGARIGTRDGKLTLVEVYKGSPAYEAGLRDDDIVKRIDDLSTVNILVTDAVTKIRGHVGTPVTLTIERADSDEPQAITVTRGLVRIPSVTAEMLDSGVIHAEISHFSQTTPADFKRRIKEIVDVEPVKGIVIDLRRNSGGSMLGSASIGDQFLSRGTLIVTAGRDGNTARGLRSEISAGPATPFARLPVAILTSKRTASGSELLAASLRNHDRAILVGERSFGKGTVQKTYRIAPESSLKLTIGRFLPNERPIPGRGMTPDVEMLTYDFRDSGVYVPDQKQDELPFWLKIPEWANLRERSAVARIPVMSSNGGDREDADDVTLKTTAEILARFGSTSASRMLKTAAPYLRQTQRDADSLLVEQLSQRGIDWSKGASVNRPSRLSVSIDVDGGALSAGEEATMTVKLTNDGGEPAYRIRGVLASESGLMNGRGTIFGMVPAGESRTWSFPIEPGARSRTGRMETALALFDDGGLITELGPMHLTVQEAGRPRLAYRYAVEETDDDTVLSVRVEIANKGDRPAEEFGVALRHTLEDRFELIDGAATVENLDPGATTELSLSVRMLGSFEDPQFTALSVTDPRYDLVITSEIDVTKPRKTSRWMQAPVITLDNIERIGSGDDYLIYATVSDEVGLTSVLTRIDEDQFDYARAQPVPQKELELVLPWRPSDGVKRFEILARNSDGLRTRYVSGL